MGTTFGAALELQRELRLETKPFAFTNLKTISGLVGLNLTEIER